MRGVERAHEERQIKPHEMQDERKPQQPLHGAAAEVIKALGIEERVKHEMPVCHYCMEMRSASAMA